MESKAKPHEPPDLREKGAVKDGQRQHLDRRLYMQLLVLGGCDKIEGVIQAIQRSSAQAVLYEDLNDPTGIGLLFMHEDPSYFVSEVRHLLQQKPFTSLTQKTDFTMFGRTYSVGYEPDLENWLLDKPRRTVLNPQWPWAIWYPLRRSGTFASLSPDQQRAILAEHGSVGHAFGKADLAHDVRLACHGLDTHDNDFVIGLMGSDLHPLSAVVQAMRRTKQTSQYLEKIGPFFIGKAAWQGQGAGS